MMLDQAVSKGLLDQLAIRVMHQLAQFNRDFGRDHIHHGASRQQRFAATLRHA